MGIVKQMMQEKHEEEYNRHIRELQAELDEAGIDMDAEDYEALEWALDKDD